MSRAERHPLVSRRAVLGAAATAPLIGRQTAPRGDGTILVRVDAAMWMNFLAVTAALRPFSNKVGADQVGAV